MLAETAVLQGLQSCTDCWERLKTAVSVRLQSLQDCTLQDCSLCKTAVAPRLQSLQDCSRTKTAVAPRLQSLQDCSRSKTAVAPRLQSLQDCSCSKTTVAPRLQSLQDYSPCKTVVAIQCPHFGYRGWIFKRIIKRTRIISSFCDYENLPTKTGTKIAF
jgi:hypothetical protein